MSTVALTTLLSETAAYAFSRFTFFGAKLIFFVLITVAIFTSSGRGMNF